MDQVEASGFGIKCAEYRVESALFDLVAALQALDHLPVGMRVFEMHVKACRKRDASRVEPPVSAPQLKAALVVGIEDPRTFPPTPGYSPCYMLDRANG